jgi:hypothetical protein
MSLSLVKDYLEGKIPTTLAVILINLALLFVLWTKVGELDEKYELRLRALEDYKLISEAQHEKHFQNKP